MKKTIKRKVIGKKRPARPSKTKSLLEIAIDLIALKLNPKMYVHFKNEVFKFYDDSCGQRLHRVEPYYGYSQKPMYGYFRVKRKLSFTNEGDKGKDGAILGILDLNKCLVVAISPDKVEFDAFTITF
jgi:hypothetical protein